jgi:hypothetical protein
MEPAIGIGTLQKKIPLTLFLIPVFYTDALKFPLQSPPLQGRKAT